jgi:hypothetical protein
MADTKKATDPRTSNNNSKKKARKQIQKKLETALSNLKPILGDKKFKRRIKKAGKVLTSGLTNINSNGSPKTQKPKANAHKTSSTQ